MLREHHERRILNFVFRADIPVKVGLTAVAFFKRFYVDRSVISYNPSVTALSALYTATKIEEYYLPVSDLICEFDLRVNGIKARTSLKDQPYSEDNTAVRVSEDALLKIELNFLEQMRFCLKAFHPMRSLGVVREFLRAAKSWPGGEDKIGESKILRQVAEYAQALLSTVIPITDVSLTHVPGLIAVAAAVIAATDVKAEPDDDTAIDVIFRSFPNNVTNCRMLVLAVVDTVRAAIRKGEDQIQVIEDLEKRRREMAIRRNDPMCDEFVNVLFDSPEDEALVGKKRAGAFDVDIGDSDDDIFHPDEKRLRSVP